MVPVADGVVYVATYSQGSASNVTALDAATGEPIDDAPPPPLARGTVEGQSYTGQPARVEVGDSTVIGGLSLANAVSSSSASSGVKPPAPRQRTWPDPSTRRSAIVDRSSMPSGRVTRLTSP